MLLVRDIRLPLAAGEQEAVAAALKKTGLPRHGIKNTGIAKLSVDARHGRPSLVYTVALELADEGAERSFERFAPYVSIAAPAAFTVHNGTRPLAHSPVVCGFGPAGLFAALLLARQGFRPIVLERGPAMEQRAQAVERFNAAGLLDENANIQFGEGGAGTFSDGKLTTRINDPLCAFVTRTLLAHGAPRDIAYKQKPHIGTDLLVDVVRTMRRQIEDAGGEVRFHAQFAGVRFAGGAVADVDVLDGRTGAAERMAARRVVLACGHSARDTFEAVHAAGVTMEQKPFSVGVRIEHSQEAVNRAQYGDAAAHPALGAADYKLSAHLPSGRGVYTFCMCPGGLVVPSSSEEGGIVTNGMSEYARDRRTRRCSWAWGRRTSGATTRWRASNCSGAWSRRRTARPSQQAVPRTRRQRRRWGISWPDAPAARARRRGRRMRAAWPGATCDSACLDSRPTPLPRPCPCSIVGCTGSRTRTR